MVHNDQPMWGEMLLRGLCLLIFTVLICPSVEAGARRIKLADPLFEELNSVLTAAERMHNAFVVEDSGAVHDSLKGILSAVKRAKRKTRQSRDIQSPHIIRYLNAISNHVEMVLRTSGDKRTEELKKAFHQLAGMVQTYRLRKDVHIFFCDNDKSTWVQKGWRAKNPIHPKLRCGLAVR